MDEFLDSASGRAEVAASVGVLVVFVFVSVETHLHFGEIAV